MKYSQLIKKILLFQRVYKKDSLFIYEITFGSWPFDLNITVSAFFYFISSKVIIDLLDLSVTLLCV